MSSQWLVGLETDLQASGLKGTTSQTQFPVGFSVTSTEVSKSLSWFGTVRGRVGFLATSQWLLYATRGLAYGETKLDFNTADQTLGCIPGGSICAAGSSSGVRVGWTAGGGVEAMIAPDWSVKAEYLYVDLGRRTMTIPSVTPAIVFTPSTQFHEQIARAGINYHFNWGGPVVARY